MLIQRLLMLGISLPGVLAQVRGTLKEGLGISRSAALGRGGGRGGESSDDHGYNNVDSTLIYLPYYHLELNCTEISPPLPAWEDSTEGTTATREPGAPLAIIMNCVALPQTRPRPGPISPPLPEPTMNQSIPRVGRLSEW